MRYYASVLVATKTPDKQEASYFDFHAMSLVAHKKDVQHHEYNQSGNEHQEDACAS